MLSDSTRESILKIIEDTNPEAFIVEIVFKRGKTGVLSIKLDTDKGISLAECTEISRKVGRMLEEEDSINSNYRLEVSSPGVGSPLILYRQYQKNVGRYLQVMKDDLSEVKGKLLEVDEATILLERVLSNKKNKKKKKDVQQEIPEEREIRVNFNEIKEAKVIII
ncbi:MAG: ribosome assembly cofactor RimP [Bacteroidetes bacterium]|nr:ribosome assembly cofactor RimP [Bacteroidota bacterium]MCB0845336.1 ribosome assembly cofactor RimP [Bacteroidota bacterium]